MCNLYSVTKSHEAVRNMFRVSHNRSTPFEPMPAIFPGWSAPIVRKADDGTSGPPVIPKTAPTTMKAVPNR